MEERAVADHLLLPHEGDAALGYHLVEVLDGLEVAIDQRLVDERPQISAGCNSGLWAGWNTSFMPSGTVRFSGRCQPALSSCSTMRFFGPAPTDLAKSASTHSK